jgi:hypothetical protein
MRDLLNYSVSQSMTTDPRPWRTRLASIPQQLAFFDDPSTRKTACCTRRAGKTEADTSILIEALHQHPKRIALYVTLTAETSQDNQEAALDAANLAYGLKLSKSAAGHGLRYHNEAGGCIWLAGCKDKHEAEKYRGLPYSIVVIDEGGTHRAPVLQYLIDASVGPALTDIGGQIVLTGTPGEIPTGFFWAASTGLDPKITNNWSPHRWSVRDNPHHPFGRDPDALEAHRIERGLAPDDPTWQREYLGLWVLDVNALIYHYNPAKNQLTDALPRGYGEPYYVLGIDLGYDDETAFVVTATMRGFPFVHVVRAEGQSGLRVAGIAQEIHRLKQDFNFTRMVIDQGGLGKTIAETLRHEYNLSVEAAEKSDKAAWIKRVQDDLANGNIKLAREALGLADEWVTLPWDDKRQNHRPGFVDHKSDAFLYSYRHQLRSEVWEHAPPEPGTADAINSAMAAHKQQLLRDMAKQRARR